MSQKNLYHRLRFTCDVFSPHLLTQQVCDFNLFIFSRKYKQVNTCSELIFQAGRFNCVCVQIVVMFLGVIDFGLISAHSLTPGKSVVWLLSQTLPATTVQTAQGGVSILPTSPSCALLKKLEPLEAAKQFFGENPLVEERLWLCSLSLHYTGKRQPPGQSDETGSAVALLLLPLLQEVMKSALPAQKLAVSFPHLAKLLDGLHLTAPSMSVKMLRAQVGKKESFTSCLCCKSAVTQIVVQAPGPSSKSHKQHKIPQSYTNIFLDILAWEHLLKKTL